MTPSALTIMAKYPQPGAVKTRLCPPLDPVEAAELYDCFLRDKVDAVRAVPGAQPAIAYTPAVARSYFARLAPGFLLLGQRGRDLGERLAGTFEDLFAAGHGSVVVIDSDTPTLPAAYLRDAVELLAAPGTDLVVGPAEDGGYYLLGLRVPCRELFERIPWSTPGVVPLTLRRARAAGLRVACLPPWFDIDTGEDLDRLRASLAAAAGGDAAHTRRFLDGHGT
jgi:hypothetical protein